MPPKTKNSSPSKKAPSVKAALLAHNLESIVAEHASAASPSPTSTPTGRKRKPVAQVVIIDSSDEKVVDSPSPVKRVQGPSTDARPGESGALPGQSLCSLVDALCGVDQEVIPPVVASNMSRPKRAVVKTKKAEATVAKRRRTVKMVAPEPEFPIALESPVQFDTAAVVSPGPPSPDSVCASDDDEAVGSVGVGETVYYEDVFPAAGGSHDANDDGLSVMLRSCPNPMLARLYVGLPPLPRFCNVMPFSGSLPMSYRTPFANKCSGLQKEDIKAIIVALAFTKSGMYVNTARIDPSLLYVDSNRLRVIETKGLALCIMTGTVTESFLVQATEAGSRNNPYMIHKITLAPFTQDFRRDTSAWGLLFGFHEVTGMVLELGFGFASRGEGKGDSYRPSASLSPSKAKLSILKAVSSPLKASSVDSVLASRSFNDTIPVYDGRVREGHPAFSFLDADFRGLSTWPLYRGSKGEAPIDAIVSIGYTLSTYKGNSSLILSSNIQFVILLAID